VLTQAPPLATAVLAGGAGALALAADEF